MHRYVEEQRLLAEINALSGQLQRTRLHTMPDQEDLRWALAELKDKLADDWVRLRELRGLPPNSSLEWKGTPHGRTWSE